ncbi:radical SAM protein [Catellatospora tritici]|uniref:radical SAM protein n=1 Tax=Catellatospora tritici TaxID=2851566 RepID=UPI001C2DD3AF|nr:radical SAM protein [Catellatospora tritici]MBV1851330.1 radical SAM protein [Catellatospora tritici]
MTQEFHSRLDEMDFFATKARAFGLTVLTTTRCNLGCAYCFQNTGPAPESTFRPPRIRADSLDSQGVDDILEFTRRRMRELGRESVVLTLFGGEPLLRPDACLRLLRGLAPLGLRGAEMVSNLVLLTPSLARKLEAAGLQTIQVSFDGAQDEHDTVRVERSGRPTFDRIIANIRAAAEVTGIRWRFRVNVSATNIDTLPDLVDQLAALPLPQRATIRFGLVGDFSVGFTGALRHTGGVTDRLLTLVDRAIDAGLDVMLLGTPLADCPYCGEFGGSAGAVVNSDGTLYSCWETAGRPEWQVGTIADGYLSPELMADRWSRCDNTVEAHGETSAAQELYDLVDARILDRSRARRLAAADGLSPSAT